MKTIWLRMVVFVALLSVSACVVGKGGDSQSKIWPFSVKDASMRDVVTVLRASQKMHGTLVNFEEAPALEKKKDWMIAIEIQDASVEKVLVQATAQDNRYKWVRKGKIVNVIPSKQGKNMEYIFSQVVDKLSVQKKDRYAIVTAVMKHLEEREAGKYKVTAENKDVSVLTWTSDSVVNKLGLVKLGDMKNYEPIVLPQHALVLDGLTVRGILNLIAEREGCFWDMQLIDEKGIRNMLLSFPTKRKLVRLPDGKGKEQKSPG